MSQDQTTAASRVWDAASQQRDDAIARGLPIRWEDRLRVPFTTPAAAPIPVDDGSMPWVESNHPQ